MRTEHRIHQLREVVDINEIRMLGLH